MSNGLKKLYNLRNPSPSSEMRGTGLFIHIEGAYNHMLDHHWYDIQITVSLSV